MAIAVRSRSTELVWPVEGEAERCSRRQALCELDGLLTELEECNLRGLSVPARVRFALRRHGVAGWRQAGAPDLIEGIFEVQEQHMLYPEGEAPVLLTGRSLLDRGVLELRALIAS